ncbi:MAG: hypothetical protein LBB53_05140 [Prevotellaceae bacterium]|jgi:hypothetical protein|nr:hypothetical protein [Prevotellaceae bacterium]
MKQNIIKKVKIIGIKTYGLSLWIFIVVFVVCCVLLWMLFLLLTPDVETNYCLEGGYFELSLPLTDLAHRMRISPEHGELLINSDLKKSIPIPIQMTAQLPKILNISYDNYDTLMINTICEFYTDNKQLIFKDDESRIMTRSQIESSQHKNGIEVTFCRNIMITICSNKNNSDKKNILIASVKNERGQFIEISTTETNADVVKIYGKITITMSGTASIVHNNIAITCSSHQYMQHVNKQRYMGKYIILF